MAQLAAWTCEHCGAEQTHEAWCELCFHGRYPTRAIQFAEHVVEHLADGLLEPLDVLKAMQARPCYGRVSLDLDFIARQMRLLTKDTTQLARQIAKARSARVMLEALETGSVAEKLQVLKNWGPETNAEHVETKIDAVTRHVVELHEGPAPKKEG